MQGVVVVLMPNMMQVIKSQVFKRFITLLIVFIFLYAMKGMLSLMLLTFVFTYLIDSVSKFLINKLHDKIRINYKVMILLLQLQE